jgi:hypothetical protein
MGRRASSVVPKMRWRGSLHGHIEERRQVNTVNHEGNGYHGTFDQKIYDLNGN